MGTLQPDKGGQAARIGVVEKGLAGSYPRSTRTLLRMHMSQLVRLLKPSTRWISVRWVPSGFLVRPACKASGIDRTNLRKLSVSAA
ncbi:hypothetical protein DU478_18645 [Thalassococcus profundi]|uniref:Uncharacterized protein n=1 Tax=Thalassococcus profundi TaxID=2282382 RepID=A0A369THP5_9RHOB|nr:hypothetical protein DU478_18645 [Thalassococcus profundi]